MNVVIRQETILDYNQIAEVNALAFKNDQFIGEVALVNSLRMGKDFDEELSLVAVLDEEIVGHVLFYPFKSYVNQKELKSVCLGPISVLPKYQKTGIGKQLIKRGHEIAKTKGYHYSFLWGHDTYYPKLGYETGLFGDSSLIIKKDSIKPKDTNLSFRAVEDNDLDFLDNLWEEWFKDVDLAVRPSSSIMDWISHYPNIQSSLIIKNDQTIGYIRYSRNNINDIKMLLAKDQEAIDDILQYLYKEVEDDLIKIPISESSKMKKYFIDYDAKFINQAWSACMINVLDDSCHEILKYIKNVKNQERRIGQIILNPSYEM